jgi:fructose-1,6-bisphosphatase I
MSTTGITLHQHNLEQQQQNAHVVENLPELLTALSRAAQTLAREIRRAALVGQLGLVGGSNPTGDAQKKLDVLGNTTVMEALAETGFVAAVVSEELPEATPVSSGSAARYVVCVDPLDGSSNADINGPVGTIFGIRRCGAAGQSATAADVLGRGSEQVAAGYVMYGPATVFVYTCGAGVNGFTWDDERGAFVLTHPDIRCPRQGHYYSANLGHYHEWHPYIQRFIDYLTQHDPLTHRPYSLRYTGALVADVHRSLLEGGSTSTQPMLNTSRGSCACSTSAPPWASSSSRRVAAPARARRGCSTSRLTPFTNACRWSSAAPKTWRCTSHSWPTVVPHEEAHT